MKHPSVVSLLVALLPVAGWCDSPPPSTPPPPQGVWTGTGQLGWLASQGNTQSKSANALLDLSLFEGPWQHSLHLGGLYGENTNIPSAERWDALWQTNYSLTPDLYTFGALRYARDLFSGFNYQASATAGFGYKFINTTDVKLSAQLGAGYRKDQTEDITKDGTGAVISRTLGPANSNAILTAGLNYSQALTDTTTLSDKLLVESGSSDTMISNALALTVKISTRLALSLGYTLLDNTKPTPGLKKLDTMETVNLVIGF